MARRQVVVERMDEPGLDARAHRQALAGIRRVNYLSTAVSQLWSPIKTAAIELQGARPLRVLDLGCGSGDTILRLAARAVRERLPIELHGCDRSDIAIAAAMDLAAKRESIRVRFFEHDVLESIPEGYDVVMCSLFLHHFESTVAEDLLRRMGEAAGRTVLVNDLLRTTAGYALCWIGCRLITTSPIVHFDGPASVRAAFSAREVRDLATRAGLTGATLHRHWPERFLLQWNRPSFSRQTLESASS